VAQWHIDLQEYDYETQYILEKENAPPGMLSQQLGENQGKEDNQGVVVLPPEKFKTQISMNMQEEKEKILIPPHNKVKRGIMNLVHDYPSAGHPEQDETLRKTQEWYYWPGMKEWITEYIKGCTTC
jgi:hypothetical protein